MFGIIKNKDSDESLEKNILTIFDQPVDREKAEASLGRYDSLFISIYDQSTLEYILRYTAIKGHLD